MTAKPMTRSWYRDEPRTARIPPPEVPVCRACEVTEVANEDGGSWDECGVICTACCELLDGAEAS